MKTNFPRSCATILILIGIVLLSGCLGDENPNEPNKPDPVDQTDPNKLIAVGAIDITLYGSNPKISIYPVDEKVRHFLGGNGKYSLEFIGDATKFDIANQNAESEYNTIYFPANADTLFLKEDGKIISTFLCKEYNDSKYGKSKYTLSKNIDGEFMTKLSDISLLPQ